MVPTVSARKFSSVAVLDQRRVPRRRPNAPKLPKRLRERILKDYVAGAVTEEVARRHGVSPQTVSNIAVRHGVARNPLRSRDEVVELIVRGGSPATTSHPLSGSRSDGSDAGPDSPGCERSNTSTVPLPTTLSVNSSMLCAPGVAPEPDQCLRTSVRAGNISGVLSVHDIESMRRSHAMAPLSPTHVSELLDSCQKLARERAEIAAVLADLPESVAALREALNRLHRLVR